MGQGPSAPTITAQDKAIFQMKQQRDKLKQYQKKINLTIQRQTELAKKAIENNDNERAKFYLRSKKHQQTIITKNYDQLDNLEQLIGTIEFKLIEKDVLYGLNEGNKLLTKLNNEMSVDKIDKILDDLEDQRLKVDEVSDLLGTHNLSNGEELEVDEEFEQLNKQIHGATVEDNEPNVTLPDIPQHEVKSDVELPKVPTGNIDDSANKIKDNLKDKQANPMTA